MDRHLVAQHLLSAWTDLLGANLPKPLAAASQALDAVEWAQAPHARLDPASVSAENIDVKLAELSAVIAAENAWGETRKRARNTLGQYVMDTAFEVLPDLLLVVGKKLKESGAVFAEALELLPENPTSDALVAGGPVTVEAFGKARDAALELDAIDRWVASLNPLYGVNADPVLRCLTPTTREGLQTLLQAHNKKGVLSPLWIAAVNTPDVSWSVNTPAQAKDIRAALDAMPASEYKKPQFVSFR
jgi:hypothetical protein